MSPADSMLMRPTGCPFAALTRRRGPTRDDLDKRVDRVRRVLGFTALASLLCLGVLAPRYPAPVLAVVSLAVIAGLAATRSASLQMIVDVLRFGVTGAYRVFWRLLGRHRSAIALGDHGDGGAPLLLVRDDRASHAVLTRPQEFARAPMPNYGPFDTRCILGAGGGVDWLRYRQAFNDYFNGGYRADLPSIERIVAERMPAWRAAGKIELLHALMEIVVELRGRVFFQHSFGCFDHPPPNGEPRADERFVDLVRRTLEPPVFALGGNPDGVCERFHAEVLRAIHAAHTPGSIGHTCKTLCEEGSLSAEEALQNASMYVLALAPSFAAFWLLYRAAATGTLAALRDDRSALLRAIKEELRIHPPVPRLMNRVALRDAEVAEQPVAADTTVIVAPLFAHHHPALWDKPESFCPHRWSVASDDPSELLREQGEDPRYFPFGAGRHQCQGRRFAAEELVILIETVLAHVDLEVLEDRGLLDTPIEERLTLHVFAAPIHDVLVRVRAPA